MTTHELRLAEAELGKNIKDLSDQLMPYGEQGQAVSLHPRVPFDSSLLEPFIDTLDPGVLPPEDKARYLAEMRFVGGWHGGKAHEWAEGYKSLYVMLRTESQPLSFEQQWDIPNMTLELGDYSEERQAWTALRLHADIVQSRGDRRSREYKLIGARVLGDPTENLAKPTLDQIVALNGIVGAVCSIVRTGPPDMT